MAYDEELAHRIRECLATVPGVDEKRMFGGLAFLVGGHLAVAASRNGGLMLRCDPDHADEFVAGAHVERIVMRGREMNGWLRVLEPALDADEDLARWVRVGVEFVRSLPPRAAPAGKSGR